MFAHFVIPTLQKDEAGRLKKLFRGSNFVQKFGPF